MQNKTRLLTFYSLGHFLVDLACAYLLLSLPISGDEKAFAFLLYNFCAFAVQMPMGLFADKLNRNSAVAAMGLCLTCIAFLCKPLPILCATVLGLGNCLYHVGGGTDVLGFGEQKQWMLGVFVSPGALGLFLGTLFAKQKEVSFLLGALGICTLSLCMIFALHRTSPIHKPSKNAEISLKPRGHAPLLAMLCLFLVVILRSYVGLTLYTPWKNGIVLSIVSVLALACGKAVGGFLADKWGAMRTATMTLTLCSVLFVFSENAICGILAIFLFNMTMPLTLFAMARIFPGARGFAFGTLTFALFLGYLPHILSLPIPFYGKVWFHAVEAAVSLCLLAIGLFACRERREHGA